MNKERALIELEKLRVLNDCDSRNGSDDEDEDEAIEMYENIQIEESGNEESDNESGDDEELAENMIDSIESSINQVLEDVNCTSKDGKKWQKLKTNEDTRIRNKIKFSEISGLTKFSFNQLDEHALSAFLVLIDKKMLNLIIQSTKAEAVLQKNAAFKFEFNDLLAFIEILYFKGLYYTKVPSSKMWNERHGSVFVKKLMSRNRFYEIMRYLRFDDKSTRNQRRNTDKFLIIREVWDKFTYNCIGAYKPNRDLTIDEQLLACKTRCSFIQFMPNKPDKFGIKFWVLAEVESKYFCNMMPYLGKNEERSLNDLLCEHVVKKLIGPFAAKGYFVTTENSFLLIIWPSSYLN